MATVISRLRPIEDFWTPTGGSDFRMEDMPSELKLWRRWSTRDSDTMNSSNKHSTIRASVSADSSCGSCGVADFELRCRSCGTTSVLFLDENERPVLPAHACPPLDTSSQPSTTSELARQADMDASDATSLFSTPSFGSEQNDSQSKAVESVASPRTAKPAVALPIEQAVESTLIGLSPSADDAALSPKTKAGRVAADWVPKPDCPVSTAMAAILGEETAKNERDFALRSRSSTLSSVSRSIKRKAIRPVPRWNPTEGESSSSAAASPYQGSAPFQAPVESMIPMAAPLQLQEVITATPRIEIPAELPTASSATAVEDSTAIQQLTNVSPVQVLVKELTLSPTESYFPTAGDLTSLAPLPPSPSRSSVYSTDSYTEDEDLPEPNARISQIGNAVPYIPYKSEPLPTPTLRNPETGSFSSSASRSPRSSLSISTSEIQDKKSLSQEKAEIESQPKTTEAKSDDTDKPESSSTTPAPTKPHLASQKQAVAQPASATQKKWFERLQGPTEMKFKFVLTPRNGAKSSAGGKKAYVLPQADEDGRIIEPSKSTEASKKSDSTAKRASAAESKSADDSGSSGPTTSSAAAGPAGIPQGVTLAELARDPNELQRLLACTMFLLNDVPDKDAAPKRLDLGVVPGRSPASGGYAMKHQATSEHEKEGMANGVKNVKWRVSMRG